MFYQADISGYDLILGCPFMVNNAMGPLPQRRCLVIESEDDLFYLLPRSQGAVSAAETMRPSMPRYVLPDRSSPWITSFYTIKFGHLQMVLQHSGCAKPTMDAFASAANHRFPRYWTKTNSAWQRTPSKEFISANPPVVQKFI